MRYMPEAIVSLAKISCTKTYISMTGSHNVIVYHTRHNTNHESTRVPVAAMGDRKLCIFHVRENEMLKRALPKRKRHSVFDVCIVIHRYKLKQFNTPERIRARFDSGNDN